MKALSKLLQGKEVHFCPQLWRRGCAEGSAAKVGSAGGGLGGLWLPLRLGSGHKQTATKTWIVGTGGGIHLRLLIEIPLQCLLLHRNHIFCIEITSGLTLKLQSPQRVATGGSTSQSSSSILLDEIELLANINGLQSCLSNLSKC